MTGSLSPSSTREGEQACECVLDFFEVFMTCVDNSTFVMHHSVNGLDISVIL